MENRRHSGAGSLTAVVLAGLLLGLLPGLPAWADTIGFDLNSPNAALGACCTGPYAHVDVNLTSTTTASVTFTSLTNGGYIYMMGDGGAVDVNVNAATFTVSTPTESNSVAGFTPTLDTTPNPTSWKGSGNVDDQGTFNLTITNFDGFKDAATSISFTLTNGSGTWASASNVLTPNADGNVAAAHIFPCATAEPGCTTSSTTIATGFAGSVPEPGTLLLAATYGGLALGWTGRRWHRNRVKALV